MKFVVCDAEEYLRLMTESLIERLGHEVVGIAIDTAIATQLVMHAKPDVVIVDLALGYNTDFDIIGAARDVGARVIVFSHTADHAVLERYSPMPIVVPKPDLVGLERTIARVQATRATEGEATAERRKQPVPTAVGPAPTGVDDSHAFYAAVGNAVEGDALLSIEAAPGPALHATEAEEIAALVRATDRVLVTESSLKVFLPGGGTKGIDAFVLRFSEDAPDLAPRVHIRAIVIEHEEGSSEAFDRLKTAEGRRLDRST